MNAERLLARYEQVADAPDAIARLRRFILDLAVRGKLVRQDPNDEPASELLKRIAEEKARLLKAGKIKVRNITARGREPIDFDCPMGWALTELGEVSLKITDGAHKTPTYVEKGVPFISVKDFSGGRLDLSNTRFIPDHEHQILYQRCDPRRGDILIGRIGTLGKAVLINTDVQFSLFVSVGLIRFDHESLNPVFFRSLLNSPFIEAEFDRIKIGGGTHTNKLNLGDLYTVALPLPPLAEQHRIVAKVDELMAFCDRLEAARVARESVRDQLASASLARLNAPDPETFQADARFALDALPALTTRPDQIKQLRQTILNLAVRGELVPRDPNDEPASARHARDATELVSRLNVDIPPNWRWVRVEDVAEARLGKMLDKAKNKGTPYPYLRNTNVHWFDIRLDDLKTIPLDDAEFEEYRLKNGDVLICEGGHGIGRTAVWRGGSEKLVFQKALHRVRPGPHLDPGFFAQCCFVYFNAGIIQTYFTGVGIPHFTGRALANLSSLFRPSPNNAGSSRRSKR
jgi:type I restriction enzyme S subunit